MRVTETRVEDGERETESRERERECEGFWDKIDSSGGDRSVETSVGMEDSSHQFRSLSRGVFVRLLPRLIFRCLQM